MVLFQGANAQGKSNLLEALYILAIAKSPRASADRELVRWQVPPEDAHAQVSAVVQRAGGDVRVQIDFLASAPEAPGVSGDGGEGDTHRVDLHGSKAPPVQKHLRVNGVPRRTSELVGEINAVMFSASDLDLVLGPPVMRRRYMDILISQIDRHYLRSLQRYQRVVSQRNHLLKTVREGRAHRGELDFWDEELAETGGYVMSRRAATVVTLSQQAGAIHKELTGDGESLELVFRPSVDAVSSDSEEDMCQALKRSLEQGRDREVAQGFTVCGPHRDDLQMVLDNMDAGAYASRGQCRTVVLAMKLAEAEHLRDQRGEEPILLLDDVLSELDGARRAHVLERTLQYQQCFITTADPSQIDQGYLSRMSRYAISRGRVEPV
jgi:DNA replication and repair protein RecF